MRFRLTVVITAFFALISPVLGANAFRTDLCRDQWMGSYQCTRDKIGYEHTKIDITEFRGRKVYRYATSVLEHAVQEADEFVETKQYTAYIDSEFHPIYSEYESVWVRPAKEGAHLGSRENAFGLLASRDSYKCCVTYRKHTIEFDILDGDDESTDKAQVPDDADLSAEWKFRLGADRLRNADSLTIWQCRRDRKDIVRSVVTAKSDAIPVDGKLQHALAIRSYDESQPVITWLDESGRVIQRAYGDGFILFPESEKDCLKQDPSKIFEITDIATKGKLSDPRSAKDLVVSLKGQLNIKDIPNDSWQSTQYCKNDNSIIFDIHARSFEPWKSLMLPIEDQKLQKYLRPEPEIESDDDDIVDLAHKIVGREKNAFLAASSIRNWVSDNIEYRNGSANRDAVDVMENENAVCGGFTTLYTALARAAGIPTRVVHGLLYAHGCFGYHAWAESFVGQWVPFDPTNDEFVDATHVKLAEGSLADCDAFSQKYGVKSAEIERYTNTSSGSGTVACVPGTSFMLKKDGTFETVPPNLKSKLQADPLSAIETLVMIIIPLGIVRRCIKWRLRKPTWRMALGGAIDIVAALQFGIAAFVIIMVATRDDAISKLPALSQIAISQGAIITLGLLAVYDLIPTIRVALCKKTRRLGFAALLFFSTLFISAVGTDASLLFTLHHDDDVDISDPTLVKSMAASVSGLPDDIKLISNHYQSAWRVVYSDGTVDYKTRTENFDPKDSVSLPVSDSKLSLYMLPGDGIQSDDARVQILAHKIVGNEKNAYLAASKLRKWVYDNVTYDDNSVEMPRTVEETLKQKTGDDLQCAVLLASLARAAGIPARLVSGVTRYGDDFVPWCWVECYAGGWVPFDGAAGDETRWIDATYIGFVQGGLAEAKRGREMAEDVDVDLKSVEYANSGIGPTTLPAGTVFVLNSNGNFDVRPPGSIR